MSDTIIRVENLSKQYVLGNNGNGDGVRHLVHDFITAPLRWLKKPGGRERQRGRKAASWRQIARGILGVARCFIRDQARRRRGHHWPERGRKKHAAENFKPHHGTHARAG